MHCCSINYWCVTVIITYFLVVNDSYQEGSPFDDADFFGGSDSNTHDKRRSHVPTEGKQRRSQSAAIKNTRRYGQSGDGEHDSEMYDGHDTNGPNDRYANHENEEPIEAYSYEDTDGNHKAMKHPVDYADKSHDDEYDTHSSEHGSEGDFHDPYQPTQKNQFSIQNSGEPFSNQFGIRKPTSVNPPIVTAFRRRPTSTQVPFTIFGRPQNSTGSIGLQMNRKPTLMDSLISSMKSMWNGLISFMGFKPHPNTPNSPPVAYFGKKKRTTSSEAEENPQIESAGEAV